MNGLVAERRVLPPFGTVTVVAGPGGLRMLSFTDYGDTGLEAVAGSTVDTRRAFTQVEAYLAGRRRDFAVAWDLSGLSPFTQRVLAVCQRIPWGQTATYRDVAVALGQPGAVRAVGGALGRNPLPIVIPCHRVVACGHLGGYTPGVDLKRLLLAIEGHADDTASMASAAAIPAR